MRNPEPQLDRSLHEPQLEKETKTQRSQGLINSLINQLIKNSHLCNKENRKLDYAAFTGVLLPGLLFKLDILMCMYVCVYLPHVSKWRG